MAKKKKGLKKSKSIQVEILKIFEGHPDYTYNYKQISSILGVKDTSARKLIISILDTFTNDKVLEQVSTPSLKP